LVVGDAGLGATEITHLEIRDRVINYAYILAHVVHYLFHGEGLGEVEITDSWKVR